MNMEDYKKIHCIESEYFTCPSTITIITKKPQEVTTRPNVVTFNTSHYYKKPKEVVSSGAISREMPLSTEDYNKSTIKIKSYKLYER